MSLSQHTNLPLDEDFSFLACCTLNMLAFPRFVEWCIILLHTSSNKSLSILVWCAFNMMMLAFPILLRKL